MATFEETKEKYEQAVRGAMPKIQAIHDSFQRQWGFSLWSEAIPATLSQEYGPDVIAHREREYDIPAGSIAAGLAALRQVEALKIDPADFTDDLSEQIELLAA